MRSRSLFSAAMVFFIVFFGCGGTSLIPATPTQVTDPVEFAARTRLVGGTSVVTPVCADSADSGAKVEVVTQNDADLYVRIIPNTAFVGEALGQKFRITIVIVVWLPDLQKFATFGYDEVSGEVLYITEDGGGTDYTYGNLRVVITPEATVACTIAPEPSQPLPVPNGFPSEQS